MATQPKLGQRSMSRWADTFIEIALAIIIWVAAMILIVIAFRLLSTPTCAHEWYSGLRNDRGQLCCNNQDCAPADGCVLPDGAMGLHVAGKCRPIPWQNVLPVPSPDGRSHACLNPADNGVPRCVVLGAGS